METKRRGICTNFGNCKNADSKLPIEVRVTEDFICPECNRDLTELVEKKFLKNLKKKYFIAFLIIILAFIGIYITIMQLTKNVTEKIVDKGVNIIENSIEDISKTTESETEATIDSAVSAYEKTTPEKVDQKQKNNGKTITQTENPPPPIEHGIILKTISFPNGDRYVGETKNGLMHGAGAYYFKESQIISKKDLKKRYAEAGDILKGNWVEGSFSNGKLFDKNEKFKETIIVGQ